MSSRADDDDAPLRSQRHPLVITSSLQARLATIFLLYTASGVALGVAAAVLYPVLIGDVTLTFIYYGCTVLLVLGAIGLSIVTANRLAGPVYRLEQTIDQVLNDKHLDRVVRLREGDEFQGLAAKLTHLIQEWRLEAATDLAVAQHMNRYLEQLERSLDALPGSEGRELALGLVRECRAEIAKITRATYLPDPPAREEPQQETGAA